MVYDSAKWNNITLAFFLVDHFPRVIHGFCFILCFVTFLLFIVDFYHGLYFCHMPFSIFCFQAYQFWSFPPPKDLLELSIFLLPCGLCLSIAVLIRLVLSAPPVLNLMFSSFLVCSFWRSTFSSSFLKENTWEEILLLVYLFENVFIQLSDLWSGLGICQSQLENCFH